MNYYQKKINELREEIYDEIVDVMKCHGATEVEFEDFDDIYFVGEYGDDLADYLITQIYKKDNGGLYVKAHNKWNAEDKIFSVKWDFGFQDLEVLNSLLIAVTEVLTKLPPKK